MQDFETTTETNGDGQMSEAEVQALVRDFPDESEHEPVRGRALRLSAAGH